LWPLFRGSLLTTIGLILVLFFFRRTLARGVPVLFGGISFTLIFLKEELVRLGLRSEFARSQFQRRFVLVCTPVETARMRDELLKRSEDELLLTTEFDLNQRSMDELTDLLHEESVNAVILSARHNYFEKVESAIRTCELEGVEVWLIADFFNT